MTPAAAALVDLLHTARRPHDVRQHRECLVDWWLQPVQHALATLTPEDLEPLRPDWHRVDNLTLLFKTLARNLASTAGLTRPAWSALNAFGNAPPWVFRAGAYRYGYDHHSCRIPWFQAHLARVAHRRALSACVCAPGAGLAACWLLDHVLTHPACRLFCLEPPPILLPRRALFLENVDRCSGGDKVRVLTGSPSAAIAELPADVSFAFVYFEGLRHPYRTSLRADLREAAIAAWRRLEPGGVMMFDDYRLDAHPLGALVWAHRPRPHIEAFLAAIDGEHQCLARDYHLTIEKR